MDEDEDAKTQPGGANKEQLHIDQIIEERTKKLRLEQELKNMARENAKLQKESMELEKSKNRIDEEQRKVEEEIRVFQQEKMRRLNKSEQSFVLRLSQLQNLEQDSAKEKATHYDSLRAERRERMKKIRTMNDKESQGMQKEGDQDAIQL